ncbi:hypothetical protein ACFUIW_12460 [Streptomyces sp. NPDC057245]|uniref:hypothetical protein n=1 Tax=Streptomyces TaxID=1883 RepID=UPI001C1E32D1|nr:hypothetical protein [Streptomyces sp. A108]MBU6534162.1 hypothetical protein [Streptomyces sp. A108]
MYHRHHHGYLWVGPKSRFDQEALRRPPHPEAPPAGSRPEVIARYREVAAEFPGCDLPPLETRNWLRKPPVQVRGTWSDPAEAAAWLDERLREYAPRFMSGAQRDVLRLSTLAASVEARLEWGGDVSLGYYLERPVFLSLALVACCPEGGRARAVSCPVG